jgi:predicted ATPase/predicted Ser/Thr protein kinase
VQLSVGTRVGPYEILAPIGAGGMGEVWKARDTRLARVVAIKQFKRGHHGRFEQEARVLAGLNHPNICQIYDVGPDYLVLEYIEGKPLKAPLPDEEALRVAIQIADALEEAHRGGILHRDLKPANVMITNTGSAKLLDFGVAKLLAADSDATSTLEGTILGTPAYMSPEQAQGKPLDERSDVFSFGAVLYEMLTGTRAFSGHSTAEIVSAILRDDPPRREIPPALDRIVRRCLAKRPSERFSNIAEVRAALQNASAPPEPQARTPGIPTGPTKLIGRQHELDEIANLLLNPDVRLINLTGPGGIGKTRLAIEVAHQAARAFHDVWFVALEGVGQPHLVPTAILHGVGLCEEDARRPESRLIEYLEPRAALLVLDTFEHVTDAARFLSELLSSCARLKILVTSRAALQLRAEREYIVHPLAIGDRKGGRLVDSPAVAMFLERSGIANPEPATAQAIAEICTRLDGLPLAIELAAGKTKFLGPEAMLARLRDPLRVLTGGPRDLPERQRTLRNTIDWSYDLLPPEEKRLFRTLSVFSGGATAEAIEAVFGHGDPLELLAALASQSLLLKEDHGSGVRIGMLDTIRQYGREQLEREEDAADICSRHAGYYLRFAESVDFEGAGRQSAMYDSFEREKSNCAGALDFFLAQGNADLALRMAAALWPFWDARGYWTEGREQLNRVLLASSGAASRDARAKALYAAGVLADAQGDYVSAREAFQEHLAIQRTVSSPASLAAAMNNLGIAALRQGDYDAARIAYMEALQILRSLGSEISIAQCLNNLGHVAMAQGDHAAARSRHLESLAICGRVGAAGDFAWTLTNLADVAREAGQLDNAEDLYAQAFSVFRQIGDQPGSANCMTDLGNVAVSRGEFMAAAQLYQEALVIFGDLGDRRGIGRVLEGLACMASARGRHEIALRLQAAVRSERNRLGLQPSRAQRSQVDAITAAARAAVNDRADEIWAEGERMHIDAAIEYALKTVTAVID